MIYHLCLLSGALYWAFSGENLTPGTSFCRLYYEILPILLSKIVLQIRVNWFRLIRPVNPISPKQTTGMLKLQQSFR